MNDKSKKINFLDFVPSNLDEAVKALKDSLSKKDVDEIKNPNSTSTQCHFSGGMTIRNEWSLWDKETVLVQWFKRTYGLEHADDISGIILDCLWRDVRGEPWRDKQLAERYLNHWKRSEEARKNNKPMKMKMNEDEEWETIDDDDEDEYGD